MPPSHGHPRPSPSLPLGIELRVALVGATAPRPAPRQAEGPTDLEGRGIGSPIGGQIGNQIGNSKPANQGRADSLCGKIFSKRTGTIFHIFRPASDCTIRLRRKISRRRVIRRSGEGRKARAGWGRGEWPGLLSGIQAVPSVWRERTRHRRLLRPRGGRSQF